MIFLARKFKAGSAQFFYMGIVTKQPMTIDLFTGTFGAD
jgi:hypothetical protein